MGIKTHYSTLIFLVYHKMCKKKSTEILCFVRGTPSLELPAKGMIPLDPHLQNHIHGSAVSGCREIISLAGVLGAVPPSSLQQFQYTCHNPSFFSHSSMGIKAFLIAFCTKVCNFNVLHTHFCQQSAVTFP